MRRRGLRHRQHTVDVRLQFSFDEPAIDLLGAVLLFFGRGHEHDKAVERTPFHIKWADGKRRSRLAPGHDDHTTSRGERAHSQIEVRLAQRFPPDVHSRDRKSTRLNSSHITISYAVFCLKKKK